MQVQYRIVKRPVFPLPPKAQFYGLSLVQRPPYVNPTLSLRIWILGLVAFHLRPKASVDRSPSRLTLNCFEYSFILEIIAPADL